jgi:hypothetical protein
MVMNKGRLLWESPTNKPAPAIVVILLGVGLTALGLFLIDPLIKNFRTVFQPWSNAGVWINIFMIIGLALFGLYLVYTGIYPKKLKGVEFYEHGVEFGQGAKRRFENYTNLEVFRREAVATETHSQEKKVAIARGIVSLIAMNPAGIGYAVGKLSAEKVVSIVHIKPHGDAQFQIPLLWEDDSRLAAAFEQIS